MIPHTISQTHSPTAHSPAAIARFIIQNIILLSSLSVSLFATTLVPAILVSTTLILTGQAQAASFLQASEIDWVDWEDLSPEQRSAVPDTCCGLYIEPEPPHQEGNPENLSISANRRIGYDDTGIVILEGDIEVIQQDGLVQGSNGTYNRDTEIFDLQGEVRIRRPGMLIVGSNVRVDRGGESSEITNASYVLHEQNIRGQADIIVYTDADGIITIDNGLYTRCEPGDNSWLISSKKITLDQKTGRGTARNVTLRINDIPVFYTPYISFPINDERVSGLLAPVMGSTRDGGFDFSMPYYFNLAANYDATLSPRIISRRGIMAGLETRYLGRNSNNIVNLYYLPDDDLYNPATVNIPNTDSPPTDDRWFLGIDHIGRLKGSWTSYVDYSAVSDEDYFQDLGNTGLSITTRSFLYRTARINYLGNNWRFTTSALGYQIIDPTVAEVNQPYDRLPKMTLQGKFYQGSNLEYEMEAEYVYFDRDINPNALTQAQINNGALVTGQRLSLEPEISWTWSTAGAFVTPTAKYKYARYELDDQALSQVDDPSRGIFMASLDSGLIFEREFERGDKPYIQTLEPRLFYLYSEYEDQSDIPIFDSSSMTFSYNQLFREDRFSGKDRIGDSNQLTVALSSRFLDARGVEKASVSIGQIVYFEDRRVTLRNLPGQSQREASSSLASEFSYQFNDNWRAFSYLEWNSSDNSFEVGNFQFRYQSDINQILNLGYRFRDVKNPLTATGVDRRIKQTDISTVWPLDSNWSLIGRWNYDHANSRNLETIAGVEYNNCCWKVRVIARKWIDNDSLFFGDVDKNTGIFLQFELKGFGSILGGNVSSILNNGITGYREREYAL